jgi:hypothetical protein
MTTTVKRTSPRRRRRLTALAIEAHARRSGPPARAADLDLSARLPRPLA